MEVHYFNLNIESNFDFPRDIEKTKSKIFNIIDNFTAFKIIRNKKLFEKTLTDTKNFAAGKNNFIVFGTGGSNLGARALNKIKLNANVEIEFHDNIDPLSFESKMRSINIDETGFIFISKSGETIETISQFLSVIEMAKIKNKETSLYSNTMIITENKDSSLHKIALKKKCLILEHHKDIGGRYSIFSNVGIVPAILTGINIPNLYNGALSFIDNLEKNYDLCASKYLCFKEDKSFLINILMTYSDQLFYFGKWYLQLWAESIGKNNKGITAIHSVGTTDQHSQLQLYLDGPKDKFFTFITTDHQNKGLKLNNETAETINARYIINKSMGDIMHAEQKATIETFKLKKIPFRQIHIPNIDEFSLGKLLALSMVETIASCTYLNVNPFNQPAVEQGKILTKKFLTEF